MISHENAVQAMLSFQGLFAGHWNSESRFLQFASLHFDVSVLEQYWSWSVGICVTSAPRDLVFEDIARAIRRLRVTHIDLTPSLAKLIRPEETPLLRDGVFITGGERLTQEVINIWGPERCMYNGSVLRFLHTERALLHIEHALTKDRYGPTEATIGCTMNTRLSTDDRPSNIGPQFDNVGSYVLVPGTTTPVLRGGVGELCVSGKLIGRGYLNRPELTEARFPFVETFQERIYRTGDLVRILHDNSFEYLGRADDQIKLRGQRMEVDEINQVIKAAIPDLDEVVTLLVQHPRQQKEQLASFVVKGRFEKNASLRLHLDKGKVDYAASVQEACRNKLPAFMVPTHVVPVNLIPLSANNKADTKQLKQFFASMSTDQLTALSESERRVGELSDSEKRIIEALAKVVGSDMKEVGKSSNIFALGLDSITVIGFARLLRETGFPTAQTSKIMKSKCPSILMIVIRLTSSRQHNRSASKGLGCQVWL